MEMEKEVKILNLDDILPNRFQPRIKFNETAILELAESIKEHGVIQPIVVRKISDKYEIIAGERRYKASVLAGKTTIPAIITDLDDKNSAEIALIENVQRQDLTPIEEAISYKKILDMGYLNQSELADKLGKTQSTIANKLRLLNLAEEVQEALLEHKISERHARSLLKLDEDKQQVMLDRIINERLTVRKTDEEIKKLLESSPAEEQGTEKVQEPTSIEVLDLDLEGKEEQKMNEELNIPTQQIIEPVEELKNEIIDSTNVVNAWETPVTPVETVQESTSVEPVVPVTPVESTVSPGFMDINKIETEAKDIYTPEPAPADLNMLLKNEPKEEVKLESPMAPTTPEVMPTTVTTPAPEPTGKFFNMFNFAETPTQPEDLEEKQVNMDFGEPKVKDTFMFNFNPLDITSTPVKEEPQVIPESETISNVAAFNPVVENSAQESTTIEPVEAITELPKPQEITTPQMPTFEPITAEINTVPPVVEEPQLVVSNTENITVNEPVTPIINPIATVEETPSEGETSGGTQFIFGNDTMSTPSVSPAEIKPLEPEFQPFNPYSLDNNNEFTQENEFNNYRIGADVTPPVATEPPKTTYAVTDMRTVINTIRECAKTLENYGFEVDLDELDFEDRYEVKFVINKK